MKLLERRPILLALAGPNGAGKTTFYDAHLSGFAFRFVNADDLARQLELDPYSAAEAADRIRKEMFARRESFVFETVFSDPVGDKIGFLKQAAQSGYSVVLLFIGIMDSEQSEQRVAMRVSQGGHNVPAEKLTARFPRTLANLATAIRELPVVLIFDNNDLRDPFRPIATYENGKQKWSHKPIPKWLKAIA